MQVKNPVRCTWYLIFQKSSTDGYGSELVDFPNVISDCGSLCERALKVKKCVGTHHLHIFLMTNDEFLWYNRYHCTKKKMWDSTKFHTFFECLNSIFGVDIKIWNICKCRSIFWPQSNSQCSRSYFVYENVERVYCSQTKPMTFLNKPKWNQCFGSNNKKFPKNCTILD